MNPIKGIEGGMNINILCVSCIFMNPMGGRVKGCLKMCFVNLLDRFVSKVRDLIIAECK